eukprot:gnl/Spiro4/4427_TR2199_c0_g1_i1.p1 gnl/Spiro4/4427_TR2199_c0_g1~~gnl/Spiro4/4427_TR2199_c0_g1_i1.p1  ORF type:complete len:677 (+),score=171.25 gnl/Spiro4/4427_TR2199_c0_g1_i1:305-2032(+)
MNEFLCNAVQVRRIVIILNLSILTGELPAVIGKPTPIDNDSQTANFQHQGGDSHPPQFQQHQPPQHQQQQQHYQQQQHQQQPQQQQRYAPPASSSYAPPPSSSLSSVDNRPPPGRGFVSSNVGNNPASMAIPISALKLNYSAFVIKARVISKGSIREYTNAKGPGRLANIDVSDSEGSTIRITFFNEDLDKLYTKVDVDRVYFFSNGSLKQANPKFCTTTSQLEITMGRDSKIEFCGDPDSIPKLKMNFTKLSDIASLEPGKVIDVIGVITEVGDVSTFTATKTNKELTKRNVKLIDASNHIADLTLWGEQAIKFNSQYGEIMAIKAARVGDFGGGRNLGSSMNSFIDAPSTSEEAIHLNMWWQANGAQVPANAVPLSAATGGGSGAAGGSGLLIRPTDVMMPLSYLTDNRDLGRGEKPDYVLTRGIITNLKNDKTWCYPSCNECNKKLTEDAMGGSWRCSGGHSQDTPRYRYVLSMQINDHSGFQWVSAFDDKAQEILKHDATSLYALKDQDPLRYNEIWSDAAFREYTVKLRSKVENYNNVDKVKHTIIAAEPVNWAKDCASLLAEIRTYGLR